MTPEQLRHAASEPRDYRVVESALNAAAAEIDRLRAALAGFFAGGFADAVGRALDKDGPDELSETYRTRLALLRAAYQQSTPHKQEGK